MAHLSDHPDLERFVEAQAHSFAAARAELAAGRKTSHWIWYVFPQCEGLGRSATSRRYAIRSVGEARAYLGHPVLGPRLDEVTRLVLGHREVSAEAIFGGLDAMKFHSSMTLFAAVAGAGSVYAEALAVFFGGKGCELTGEWLGRS